MHLPVEKRLEAYSARLLAYANALCRDREAAQDLFHEGVVRALQARNIPDAEPAFRAWLFTILRNVWIDQLRSIRRKAEIEEEFAADLAPAPVSLETVVVDAFAIRQAYACLSVGHREILALVDVTGFSYEEAAAIIGVPAGTVMSRVSRARRALAARLADDNIVSLARRRAGGK
ncbi:RNA polymerase sigma factor [Aestuariivirga sp.]|uniref:RNA polymerase sigma factor n=1 Tax=Aestuariivirga sp. TaxID=2650926 RepID=UPI00391B14DF